MKKVIIILAIILFAIPIVGCGGFAYDEHLDGPYRLVAVDINEQMTLSYDLGNGSTVGRVGETVFSVGWNSTYVVTKRHPNGDKSVLEYYYIVRLDDGPYVDPKNCVKGPFTKAEYSLEKSRLSLPEFSRELSLLR